LLDLLGQGAAARWELPAAAARFDMNNARAILLLTYADVDPSTQGKPGAESTARCARSKSRVMIVGIGGSQDV
jgi:hypothetical protein